MVSSKRSAEEERADNTIRARLNRSFTIALDSLPTAGYKWTVEYDSSFLRLDNEWYMTPQPSAIGGGSTEVFAFTPLRLGMTEISAIYKRPWEDKVEDERTFEIQIIDQ